jgi:DNA-binding transcriptional LysR family regulator
MAYDLAHLRAFKTVHDLGSLGRAAEALGITQPALSRTVRRLEAQVAAPLFERHTRGMLPTDVGRALLPHATLLLRQSDAATEEMQALQGLARGTVRVGTLASLAGRTLSLAIADVLEKHPNLQVQVVEGTWDQLHIALGRYEVDLALGALVEDSEEVISVKDCRWTDSVHVIAAADHALQSRHPLHLQDLIGCRWALTPQGTPPYNGFNATLALLGLPMPTQLVQTRSVTLIKSLVVHAGFLGWCPRSMYETECKAGLIAELPVAEGASGRTLTVFRRRHGPLPLPAVQLLNAIRGQVPHDT